MTRPLAYISAPWGTDNLENATNAANYCRQVYEAGYSPICPVLFMPTFLKGDAPPRSRIGRKWPMNCSNAAVSSSSAATR